ncbi:DHHC palmitoyltransferase-domain-containing protein [Blastocladiella britannica]|nr:DHHC palmitoyltransferase-domain-containing protein [Blastocladiella britannica]
MLDADPLDLDHNGLPFQIKYCQTCKVSRGPRTFHCSTCDNCISGHDHHCPYTSNCIGAANYKYFVTFLTHAMFLDLMVIGSSIAALAVHATDLGTGAASALRALPMAGVLTVIAALISMSLIPLTTYHWTLLARNMTTHEHVRYGVDDTWRNPWARRGWTAWIRNAVWVLCRPLPPQAVKWYLPHRVFEHQHQHQRLSRTAVAE